MTDYVDLPQEVKDKTTEEQWDDLIANGVKFDIVDM